MIHAYTGNGQTIFESVLAPVLELAPALPASDLCALMRHYNSDKGQGRHNYTRLYDALLHPLRNTASHVFEFGIGEGSSLRGWRDYFPKAEIVGADIVPELLFEEDRIATFSVDVTDYRSVQNMWRQITHRFGDVQFDLILDDSFHNFKANTTALSQSWHMLKPGGFYIIEDIMLLPMNVVSFQGYIEGMGLDGVIVELPHRWNYEDNCVALLRKPV